MMFVKENTDKFPQFVDDQKMYIRTQQEYTNIFHTCELEIVDIRTQNFNSTKTKHYDVTMFVLKPKIRGWEGWGKM